jgi:hypothetical protein
MPNHDVAIEQAALWDILDRHTIAARAAYAPADPREQRGKHALAVMGRELLNAADESEAEGLKLLHKIASPYIGNGPDAVRRQRAGLLAQAFGARPDRLCDFLAYKWGLFKRADITRSS